MARIGQVVLSHERIKQEQAPSFYIRVPYYVLRSLLNFSPVFPNPWYRSPLFQQPPISNFIARITTHSAEKYTSQSLLV